MTREEFKRAVRIMCPDLTEAQVEMITLAAGEYGARLIELHARPPRWEDGVAC